MFSVFLFLLGEILADLTLSENLQLIDLFCCNFFTNLAYLMVN